MATRRGPDGTVRFSVSGLMGTTAWANVLWSSLTMSGTPSQADLDTWLTAVAAAYKTRFQARLQPYVSFAQAQAVLFLPGNLVLPSIVAMTGNGTGTLITTAPQDICSVISWQTGVYWRGGKPRTYLPLPHGGGINTDHKTLTSGEQALLLTAANGFRTDVAAVTSGAISASTLGFVSFRTANADRVPPLFYAYTGAKIHPRLGTQRRRMGKWLP